MEELVAFLFDELAMDGRAGTSKEGFLAAIERYHVNSDEGDAPVQLVDDDYAKSVFLAMSQYSSVSMGRRQPPELPLANDDELKQADQKRGTKNKIEVNKRLDSVSIESGDSRTQYFPHDDARIVLDEDLVRLKLTGSADTKLLSVSDYLILQIIAKNRERSTPAMEIRKKSACPTQTVFSFTKTLIEKGLVVKFTAKSQGSNSNHYLYRRYVQDNDAYQALLRGKGEIAKSVDAVDDNDDDGQQEAMERAMEVNDTVLERSLNLAAYDAEDQDEDEEDEEDEEELVDLSADEEGDGGTSAQRKSKSKTAVDLSVFGDQRSFPQMPIERQETYIRNPVLLRGRLYKLMLASENHTVIRKGLWMRLGFEYLPTTKMKMFHGIVRRQIDAGLMAEVMLGSEAIVPGLQLTDKGLAVAQEDDDARMDTSQRREQAQLEVQLTKAGPAYQLGIPWERQIVECIKQSEQTTSEEVALKLHHSFEAKRHVDEVLASVAKESSSQNPGAALDLAWDKENATRKRLKYARYTLLSAREESAIDTPEALARLTGFHAPETSHTWTSHEDLRAALLQGDTSRATGKAKGKGKAKKDKDKEKAPSTSTRPAKAYTNPIDPATNKPRKGRPRKSDGAPAKRKATDDDAAGGDSPPAKRGRGRPRKTTEAGGSNSAATGQAAGSGIAGDDSIAVPPESSTPNVEAASDAGRAGSHAGDQDAPMELADATEGDVEPTMESGDGLVATAGPSQGSSTSRRPAPLAQETTSDDIAPQAAAPAAVVSSSDVRTAQVSTAPTTATSTRQLPAAAAAKKRGEAVIALLNFCGGVLEERYFRRAYDEWIESQGLDEAQATAFKEDIGDLKDSKTRERILRLLEDEGKIKVTKTNAKRKEAANNRPADMRQTVILYTSSTDAATVMAYILRVQSEAHGGDLFVEARKARAAAKIQPRPSIKTNGSPEAVQGSSSGGAPPQIIQGEASVLTDRPLLEVLRDNRTREQFAHSKQALRIFYGYKQGRLARLRSLHIAIMASFARDGQADDDEEDEERETTGCIDPDWLWAQAPLSLFVTVKQPVRECPELSAALKDPRTRTRPISEQSSNIKSALAAVDADSVRQFFEEQFLEWYKCMGLAETSQDDSSDEVDEAPDSRCRFELGPWRPPIYLKIPSSAGTFTKPLVTHAGQFWDFIRQCVDDHSRVLVKHLSGGEVPFLKTSRSLARELDKVTAWRGGFTMLQSVANLLQRMLDDPEVRSELKKEEVRQQLSHITFLPRHVLESYLARHLGGAFAQQPHTTSAATSGNAATTQAATSPRKTQARTTKTKSRRGRKDQWDEILDTFCKDNDVESRKEDIREALNLYRRAFVSEKDDALSLRELKKLFAGALAAFQKPAATVVPAAEEEAEEAPASKAKDKKKKRTKKKGDATGNDGDEAKEGKKGRTRSTFDWTKENMELLRDACVIIRAREAYRAKVNKNKTTNSNWKVLLDLEEFAGQTTANLRSKFNSLSAAVGEEAYLAQLEEDWDILWEQFRGQDTLPDEDPTKPDAFDLRTHIKFLRDNIDKNELLIDLESDGRGLPLPARLADLKGVWHLRDDRTTQEDFDDVIKAEVTLVQKQSSLLNNGFAFERSGPSISTLRHNHRFLCETVVKMVVNTDEDEYTGAAADALVEAAGVPDVALAMGQLQRDKVVRPLHQSAPGRRVAYQEAFSKLRKTIPGDLDQLAQDVKKAGHQLADEFEAGDLVVLPDRNDGHTVMLATMLVQGQVEASIDLAEMQDLRDEKLFSAKEAEDERLEFKIHLTRIEDDDKAVDDDLFELSELSELPGISNEAVSWLPFDDDWKDLQALGWQEMTEAARSGYDKGFEEQDVLHLQVALEAAGPLGIRVETLRSPSALALARYVLKSSSANRPMAFTTGYDVPRIISGTFLSHWSVKTSVLAASGDDGTGSTSTLDSPYVMPRSWLDLYGRPLQEAWHTGLLQVLGHLNTRSGASRRQAFFWLRPVFDRLEACDLVWTLHEVGLVEVRIVSGEEGDWKVLAAAINRSRQEGERRLAEKVEWETTPDDQVMLVAKRGVVKAF